jgi:hypothetical protein
MGLMPLNKSAALVGHTLAVDPGVSGGMALYQRSTGDIVLRKWTTESDYLSFLKPLLTDSRLGSTPWESDMQCEAVIEDVPPFVAAATSNASSFKLGFNFGFHVGALRAIAVPTHLVRPKKWQAGLRGLKPNMGTTARKRMLKDNAIRLYPGLGGITNATADALLILDWWLNR